MIFGVFNVKQQQAIMQSRSKCSDTRGDRRTESRPLSGRVGSVISLSGSFQADSYVFGLEAAPELWHSVNFLNGGLSS